MRRGTNDRAARLALGQFDTPHAVAALAWDGAVRSVEARVWEPSCGPGAFLRVGLDRGHRADRLVGTEIDPDRVRRARAKLPGVDVRGGDLFAERPEVLGRFDAIIGNPPFVRPERLEPDLHAAARAAVLETTGFAASGRADLAVLALLHATAFLRDGGRLAFVMPNTWMDAAYADPVRAFLLQDHRVVSLVESRDVPWFLDAAVNCVVVVLERTRRRVSTECIVFEDGDRRTHEVALDGGRWTVPLRAPASWHAVQSIGGLRPLTDVTVLGYGTKVGIAPFFTPRVRPPMEDRWVRPFLRTLRDAHRYVVDPADVSGVALDFSPDPEAAADPLRNPKAARWIADGTNRTGRAGVPFPTVRSVLHHQPWYALPALKTGPLLVPQFRAERHYVLANPAAVPVNNSAWWARPRDPCTLPALRGLLNTTWMALAAEVLGRTNLGEGLLTLYGPDLKALPVPWPADMRGIAEAFDALATRPVRPLAEELEQDDRRRLDALVGRALGWPGDLVDEVRADAMRLLKTRIRGAEQLRSARRRLAAIRSRPAP